MFSGIPYISFFFSLIWFIGIMFVIFIVLNMVRNILVKGMVLALRAYEFFLGLLDVMSVVLWLLIITTFIGYLLLEMSFSDMFTTIFVTLLPLYIVFIAVKFSVYNIANKTEVDEFA